MIKQNIRLTVDIVVFSVMKGELQVLLIKRKRPPFKGQLAIPGGFVEDDESLREAALRELHEETGVKNIFIKKLTAYGDVNRDPRGRTVSVVFMALIDREKFKLRATEDAAEALWINIDAVRRLAFDHNRILDDSWDELRYEVQTTNIASQLLPELFTLAELQALYESILNKKLDKRNFRKRMKSLGILLASRETQMEGAHRPARLYRFRYTEYKNLKLAFHHTEYDNIHC